MSKNQDVDKIVISEVGDLNNHGFLGKLLCLILFTWSMFQLWYASPLPYIFGWGVLNEDEAKIVHLIFASMAVYLLFPLKNSTRLLKSVDILFATAAVLTCLYLLVFRDQLADRPGLPTTLDIVVGITGLLVLLESTRRALGWPLVIVSIVFMLFALGGQFMPDVIAHKGASIVKIGSHQWLTTEGVFGVALGVSATLVFLFVLFGALLDVAGAGSYLIHLAFAMLGRFRGGPAKAAVLGSGLSGIASGSSIANVVTTGTFTIPLMKRVGFPAVKAGAIEVAASTNGQLTPPVMGAAAFLMVEYVGISYEEVIKHAILPAIISYIALIYIVHLEALKLKMEPMESLNQKSLWSIPSAIAKTFITFALLYVSVNHGSLWVLKTLGNYGYAVMIGVFLISYVWLVKLSSKYKEITTTDPYELMKEVSDKKRVVLSGLYFVLPLVVLGWGIGVMRYSPQQSVFFALLFLVFIVVTHKPIKAYFRNEIVDIKIFKIGLQDLVIGMMKGAQNMVGIGIATATAGIIVGVVTMTGLGQMMTEFVELISGGNLILILVFTAILCIVLGMGLPTTANYIVVSSLMVPVIVNLGAENGLIVPIIAVHLFVFYFGILADDTPPVGLAAFAAAAISGADPIKTGIQGFTYDIRTAILPFMFIFNTELILIGVDSLIQLVVVVISAITAILVFAAATQGYWLVKSKLWETLLLLLVAFLFFRPDAVWDKIYPPYELLPSSQLSTVLQQSNTNDFLRLQVSGTSIEGKDIRKIVLMPISSQEEEMTPEEQLTGMGLSLSVKGERLIVESVSFNTAADKVGIESGFYITGVQHELKRLPKELMYFPALLLLLLVRYTQVQRKTKAVLKVDN